MSTFVKTLPTIPAFTQKGLKGFQFPLNVKSFEVYFVESSQGHDDFVIAEKLTHTYYILEGSGVFEIADESITVAAGNMIEIPPETEFCYSGKMKLSEVTRIQGYNFSIEDIRYWAIFDISSENGILLIYTGFWLSVIGLILRFWRKT